MTEWTSQMIYLRAPDKDPVPILLEGILALAIGNAANNLYLLSIQLDDGKNRSLTGYLAADRVDEFKDHLLAHGFCEMQEPSGDNIFSEWLNLRNILFVDEKTMYLRTAGMFVEHFPGKENLKRIKLRWDVFKADEEERLARELEATNDQILEDTEEIS